MAGPSEDPQKMDASAFSQLVYRSVASAPLSPQDLRSLMEQARARNAREAITGLLVFDRGCFVQWLEGPRVGIERVWAAIQRDGRHHQVERLHTPWRHDRLFPDWRLQLGLTDGPLQEVESLAVRRSDADGLHRPDPHAEEFLQGISFWHALPDPVRLATLLAHGSADEVQALAQRILALGPSVPAVGWHLLGPVSRALGDLWAQDHVDGADLLIAQGRLQALIRAVLPAALREPAARSGDALVVPVPGETHLAGVTYAAIALDAAGWQVSCLFPKTEAELCELLRRRPADVLHLAMSDAFLREDRLPRLQATIRAVREAAANPALQVLVSGRSFAAEPGLALVIGADGNGLGAGSDASDLHAMCAFAQRRSVSKAAMATQATLVDVAAQMFEKRYGATPPAAAAEDGEGD